MTKRGSQKWKEKISLGLKRSFENGRNVWNKNKIGLQKSPYKGIKYDEIYGKEKSNLIKNKISKSKKGKPNLSIIGNKYAKKNKGRKREPFSEEWKRKIGDANRGRKFSEEHKRRIALSLKGIKKPEIKKWLKKYQYKKGRKLSREIIKKQIMNSRKGPNKPEKLLIQLLKENNLPYKYVGCGEVIISSLNPDFINCNGQKKLIEVFGNYWHQDTEKDKKRLNIYKKYGFKTLIIWDDELKNLDNTLQRIINFDKS